MVASHSFGQWVQPCLEYWNKNNMTICSEHVSVVENDLDFLSKFINDGT